MEKGTPQAGWIVLAALALSLALYVVLFHPGGATIRLPTSVSRARQWGSEDKYKQWLSTFTAADAAYQAYCEEVLHNSTRFSDKGAQFSQDVFLFHNLYWDWPMRGRKGFYVESGANDPLALSTSLFFDKCLGWSGLCIEPQPQYHKVN